MKCGEKLLACTVGTALLAQSACAIETTTNPYEAITARNLFGLKSPPPAPGPEEVAKPPPVNITLTGITTIMGKKRAFMESPPPAAKPGEPAKGKQFYILMAGERQDDVEVLDIDEKAGSVKVRNGGMETTLTFEKNGPKIASAAPPGGAPPPGGMPGGAVNPNPFAPSGAAPGSAVRAGLGSFSRPLRVPSNTATPSAAVPSASGSYYGGATPAASYGTAPGAAAGTIQAGNAAVPVSGLFGSGQQRVQPNYPPDRYDVSPEEQTALLMVQRQQFGKDGPPMPPLPGDPTTQQQPTTQNQNQTTGNQLPLPRR